MSLKGSVLKAVETYNRYRSPEATAKLVKFEGKELVVDFGGTFCKGCGAYDYFEDFIYELKGLVDIQVKISSFEPRGTEGFRVKYTIKE